MSEDGAGIAANRHITIIGLIGKLTGFLGLFGAYLFYAGYEFLSSYFREFQIPLWLLDLPAYTYPVHSRTPIVLFVIVVLIGVVFGWLFSAGLMLLERKIRRTPLWSPSTMRSLDLFAWVAGVAVVLFFTGYISYGVGIQAARHYVVSNLVGVTLTFKNSPETSRDERLVEANNAGRLKMLTQTKDLVIIYEDTDTSKAQVVTYVIARSELSSVRSSRINTVQ